MPPPCRRLCVPVMGIVSPWAGLLRKVPHGAWGEGRGMPGVGAGG
jgi:hypothetical protein